VIWVITLNALILILKQTQVTENEILKKLISQLTQEIKDRQAVSSLSSTVAYNSGFIWDKELIPLDKEFFQLSDDKKALIVLKGGTYRITLQILNQAGKAAYPYLTINNEPKMYAYGSGASYNTATLNVIFNISAGSNVKILAQDNGVEHFIYIGMPIYNYFCMERIC